MRHRPFIALPATLLAVASLAALVHAQNRPPEPKGPGGRGGGEQKGKQYAAPAGDGQSPGKSQVSITVEGAFRVIRANGQPDHAPGPWGQ